MKHIFTFLILLFTVSGLFAQAPVITECTVKIVYVMNMSLPPSYTFSIDPKTEGAKYLWTFGDNTVSDSPSPTHTYKLTDTYEVKVSVTKEGKVCNGLIKTRFESGTITPTILTGKGKVKKTASTDGCGLQIIMDNGTTLVPIVMASAFEFKDGQYLELTYELLNDISSGCSLGVAAKISKITNITPPTVCKIQITYTKNSSNPVSYTFKTDPQPDGSTYLWYFGDGGSATTSSPTYIYKNSNTYVINLKVVDKAGKVCYGEAKASFEGLANLSYSGSGKVKKLTLEGCDLAIGLETGTTVIPYKIVTDFLLKEGQYVEFTYEKYAEKVSTCKEGTDVKILTIKEITTTPVCKAYFTATNELWSNPAMMKKMVFANLSTGDIKECLWNFGDNTTSTELRPLHEYAAYGEYKVCLTISTLAGCKSDYCATVKVENPVVVPTCKFDIVVKPKEGSANTFLFYAASSSVINTWKWNFGDGKTSDLQSPEHVYEKPGTYEVLCIVATAAGCTETRTIKQTVLAAPLANCSGAINILLFDPTNNLCNGKATVSLKDASGIDIPNVKYIWSDNQTTSSVENLCSDKTYSVQAIVEGVCQKSYSFTFLSKPIWRASTVNGQSNFSVVEPKEGVQYEWNFGNGTVLTGANVNFNFATDGVYEVTLKAASAGDFSESTQQVVVNNSITGTNTINKSELKIYPNPVKDMLKINFGNPVEGKLLIEIINIAGQKSYTQQLNAEGFNHAAINVQQLKSGIYFLRITNGQRVISDNKFIKID